MPVDRLAAAQPVENVPGQRSQQIARAAIGEDSDPDAEVRQERHAGAPTHPASTVKKDPVPSIAVALEAETIVRRAELGEAGLSLIDARRMEGVDQPGRHQWFAVELPLPRCSRIQFARSMTEVFIAPAARVSIGRRSAGSRVS